ncbi:E3 ubiquitin-protein ligase rnf213-alpha-like [Anarrhichthys ocellatus]|uniref:E3 ubiquitin-protein ligase rnf213-alpha-like n=1 Tax=Anarrhichthys ocellatus TaxID=433405 RepID=UPI0012EDDC41|nr:E3 ubiquitin-protein ligase rnf213-alpha-like [Anarrhichthys ocellatus]
MQKQQPGNRDVDVSTSPKHSSPLSQNISETSTQVQAQQTFPSSEYMLVYFHAVTSKDCPLDPEKDEVFLMSEKMFGHWDAPGLKMSFTRFLGDKRYLVEGKVMIPRNLIHESIPYKYVIFNHNDSTCMYETIYQKDENQLVNRCLKIKEDFLTHEGEWHQYDDVIHRELKKKFWSWNSIKDIVLKGRDQAGRVMLSIIFDLPTSWNKPNLDNFFLLLQQFFYTYSNPLLHHGTERPWGLPYNHEQVKNLLKRFLEENINHNPRKHKETTKSILPPLRAGVVSLLIYNKYLKDDTTNQLSGLCDLLCLPNMPQHHFLDFWKDFTSPLSDKKSIADAVEILCNKARQHQIEKWVLVIPLIHLLRGDSKPFEPVPPVSNPQFDSWSGLMGSKGTHFNRDNYVRGVWIMKEHAYLTDIDRLLVHSWMTLVRVNDLTSLISTVKVELLDILHYMPFTIKSGITHSNYKALEVLACYLIDRESHRSKSVDDKYKECCLKTAVRLLGSICHHTTDPGLSDVPICFLDLVCLIANACDPTDSQSRDRNQESILETLETMRKWRRNTFRNKLLQEWNRTQFSVLREIKVWDKLVSVSFNHQEHTSLWRTSFLQDFEGKLKQEHPEDQIGIYTKKMEELSRTSPLLCNTMEKCAVEAIAAIAQDKSGRAASALLEKHDITKFGKLMSAAVLNTWPTDASGAYIEGEDFMFEYLLNWPMAKTFFQMIGARGRLIDKLSDEVQIRMTLAS